jgi:tetratricopeptide (TPR) repeat protein
MIDSPSDTAGVKASFQRVLRAVCALVALLGAAPPALAVDELAAKVPADSSDDADALIEQGIALRRSARDAEALPLFQRAERLAPRSARVQVHLAATYQALGEWEAADRYLTRALEQSEDPYIQRHQSTLAAARRRIDAQIGSLEVLGPPGTKVRLNGRLVGTLPTAGAIRVAGGIYALEAQLDGHYPVTRSVALAGGSLVRESIRLEPMSARRSGSSVALEDRGSSSDIRMPRWVTWTLTGLTLGAGTASAFAWAAREEHAKAWNDDGQCLRPGQTREQVCGGEIEDGERAERLMWIGTAATGVFATATVISFFLQGNAEQPQTTAKGLDCGIGLGQLQCAGRF